MKIRLLSNDTINRIAAGEVIARPASVVKELLENSIDANSKRIVVRLEEAGKNLISVWDDGIGMDKNDLELSIHRHATSKIDEDDILNINTLGFRGEALPSIGAISKLNITSSNNRDGVAYSIEVFGGIISQPRVATRERGTTVEVRDLFFAVPARLKFLRSDRSELEAIMHIVKHIMLSQSNIEFQIFHNSKQLMYSRAHEGAREEQFIKRISDVMGPEFVDNALEINFRSNEIEIVGYTSLPTFNKVTSNAMSFFVNSRPIKDKIFNAAFKVAYQNLIPHDRYPTSVMFLTMPTKYVDVNVHPAKTEVRFYDSNNIRTIAIAAIKDALNKTGYRVSSALSDQAIKYMQNTPESNMARDSASEQDFGTKQSFVIPSILQNISKPKSQINLKKSAHRSIANGQTQNMYNIPPVVQSQEFDESYMQFPLGAALAQVHDTYIVAQTLDGIIIVDQHAAHERIGYEKIKDAITKNGLIKQRLLIPEVIEMDSAILADILIEHSQCLYNLGLGLAKFGTKSIIVSELPSIIGNCNISQLIKDVSEYLAESGHDIALTNLIEGIIKTYACHFAIRSGKKLKSLEMNELLRQMENLPFSGQCNHGRPTYIVLKLNEIEKLFSRK